MFKIIVVEKDDEKFRQDSKVSFAADYVLSNVQDIFEHDTVVAHQRTFMSTLPFGIEVQTIYEGEVISNVQIISVEFKGKE